MTGPPADPRPAPPGGGPPLAVLAALVVTVLLVWLVQWWLISAGLFTLDLPAPGLYFSTGHYVELARAFAAGKLHLLITPSPELLALPNPYDPAARQGIRSLFDASLFNGRYYLYFGPVPALILLALQPLVALDMAQDALLVLLFAMGLAAGGAAAVWQLGRLAGRLPLIPALVAVAALGIGQPAGFMLGRPAVYEAAILGGQCFLVAGVAAGLAAWRSRWTGWWLLAGLMLALTAGTRLSLLPAAGLLIIVSMVLAWRRGQHISAAAVALPMLAALVLLGAYNQARFGSPLETGHRYQLTAFDQAERYDRFFRPDYVPYNAALLFGAPFRLQSSFPYVQADGGQPPSPPAPIIVEPPVGGLFWLAPVTLLGLILFGFAIRNGNRPLTLALAGLGVTALLAVLPDLAQRFVAMRYEADAAPLLVLLAFGATAALAARLPQVRAALSMLFALTGLATVAAGVLLGTEGLFHHVAWNNPALAQALVEPFSTARARSVSEAAANQAPGRVYARFGGELELIAAHISPPAARVGQQVTLTTWWRALKDNPDGLTVDARLLGLGFAALGGFQQNVNTLGVSTPAAWPKDEIRQDNRTIVIPTIASAPDLLRMEFSVRAPDGKLLPIRDSAGQAAGDRIQAATVRLRPAESFPPAGFERRNVQFGEVMDLVGVHISATPPGDSPSVNVVLAWRAREDALVPPLDARVTVALLDSGGKVVAEASGVPGEGWYPVTEWLRRDMFLDEYDVELPAETAGDLLVRVSAGTPAGPLTPIGEPIIGTVRVPR